MENTRAAADIRELVNLFSELDTAKRGPQEERKRVHKLVRKAFSEFKREWETYGQLRKLLEPVLDAMWHAEGPQAASMSETELQKRSGWFRELDDWLRCYSASEELERATPWAAVLGLFKLALSKLPSSHAIDQLEVDFIMDGLVGPDVWNADLYLELALMALTGPRPFARKAVRDWVEEWVVYMFRVRPTVSILNVLSKLPSSHTLDQLEVDRIIAGLVHNDTFDELVLQHALQALTGPRPFASKAIRNRLQEQVEVFTKRVAMRVRADEELRRHEMELQARRDELQARRLGSEEVVATEAATEAGSDWVDVVTKRVATSLQLQASAEVEEQRATETDSTCIVCMDAPGSMGFLHGASVHVGVCASCAALIMRKDMRCPVCRETAVSAVKVFGK